MGNKCKAVTQEEAQAREATIQRALQAFGSGTHRTITAAARAHGIPRETLRDRLNRDQQSRMSGDFEQMVIDAIREEARLASRPMTRPWPDQVQVMANHILSTNGDPEPVTRLWVDSFIRRHRCVRSYRPTLPAPVPARQVGCSDHEAGRRSDAND
ncbi:hypothetical protein K505DRAFT_99765 [Melanomma pulvis-pyrius CBS 109.77]|uniref:HTH psq-type domain-containing protein n=1 Tax=Melanomma pulvis-pyrius CBS 109.77 TaxID=1314802 RepID=A0A6A6WYI1_9PLEO|nr:hypothetical protein K505DRAFT_99765 [Melanomma pulvis-pyrius CBS 109.77]